MYYEKFDIVEAYYLFLSHYHEGQNSNRYKRLCKILNYFKPRPMLKYESLTENSKNIYDNLLDCHRYRLNKMKLVIIQISGTVDENEFPESKLAGNMIDQIKDNARQLASDLGMPENSEIIVRIKDLEEK